MQLFPKWKQLKKQRRMAKEIQINKEEYGNILRQAVAEIRDARNIAAKQLASAANSVYWNLGKLLFENN